MLESYRCKQMSPTMACDFLRVAMQSTKISTESFEELLNWKNEILELITTNFISLCRNIPSDLIMLVHRMFSYYLRKAHLKTVGTFSKQSYWSGVEADLKRCKSSQQRKNPFMWYVNFYLIPVFLLNTILRNNKHYIVS